MRLHFNVLLSTNAAQDATPLFCLASLQVCDYQITILVHPFTEYGWRLETKWFSITAVDATCQRCTYIHQKPGLRSQRPDFLFFFFVILPVTEPLQPGNNQVGAALTSAARGNAGIWSRWPQGNLRAPGPSLFLPSHYSFICLSFGEPPRAVVIATTGPADALRDYFLTEFLPEFSPQKVGPPRPNSCVCLHTCKRGRSPV